MLLVGALTFATGASIDGIRQAREWQYAGDIAMALDQPLVAHVFYEKVAKTFPNTTHGQLAQERLREIRALLREPAVSPAHEPPGTWEKDLTDFLTWP
jgi:hypothetical protein